MASLSKSVVVLTETNSHLKAITFELSTNSDVPVQADRQPG